MVRIPHLLLSDVIVHCSQDFPFVVVVEGLVQYVAQSLPLPVGRQRAVNGPKVLLSVIDDESDSVAKVSLVLLISPGKEDRLIKLVSFEQV